MIEGDTFQPIKKPINKVDTIIHDPFLSQFKYHFIIRKLPILHIITDRSKWPQFINNLYKGFNAHFMGHNSVHIAQILNLYQQNNTADLILGLRRDQHAIKVYREGCSFEYGGQKFQVEVAEGFKTYLDELNQKYRIQAAEREKLRAQENQSAIKYQQNSVYRSPIGEAKPFSRKVSNSISYVRDSPNKSRSSQQQQGQIIESEKKSQHRKNSSDQSYESRSSKPHQSQTKKVSVSRSQSKNINNREELYIQSRSNKKRGVSKSSSYSSRSRSNSSPQYKKPKVRDRSSRQRHRNNYSKRTSSYSSSYSSKSQERKYSKGQRYYDKEAYVRKRSPTRKYRHVEERRKDQNQKYQLPPTFERVYSYNSRSYSQQQLINPEFNRKYSQEQYRPPNRNDDYYEHPKPHQSYYYKHAQDYSSYHRYPSNLNEEQSKSGYRGNPNRKNQNSYRGGQ